MNAIVKGWCPTALCKSYLAWQTARESAKTLTVVIVAGKNVNNTGLQHTPSRGTTEQLG